MARHRIEPYRPDDDDDELGSDGSSSFWRRLLVSGGALLGAAAAYNAYAKRGVDRIPISSAVRRAAGVGAGGEFRSRNEDRVRPLLLIHGIHAAAWSFEWRHNVDYLARDHTVYTIDLLGFGRSDRPAIRYTSRTYISLISDFVAQVIGGSVCWSRTR